MRSWRLLLVVVALMLFSMGAFASSNAQAVAPLALDVGSSGTVGVGPDAYNLQQPLPSGPSIGPDHLIHPCGGMFPEPPFQGLSPLAIAYVPGMCSFGYGDIGVWQADGHNYVVLSGFDLRLFHIWNVDDPYNPQLTSSLNFPSGGSASTSIFPFKQGSNHYVSVTMRGSGTGCGFFVYNVNNPASPQFVARKQGTDWCTPHENFVSADANGDADYAWVAMSGEGGSGYKVVVLDLHDLSNMTETGRYQRPDANSNIFVHDVTVIGNRVFLAHWTGGVIIHDKETLAHSINPTPLNPINSIRPSGFAVHHTWPTTDGNHLFIEDETLSSSSAEKVKVYNIADLSNPYYESGIIGPGIAASNQAHNLKILNQSPGHDLLFVGWYKAGTEGFQVDTTGPAPVITATISHRLSQSAAGGYGNAWGVDYQPCTVRGRQTTCVYTGDLTYGLVSDALGYDPALDPYSPESQITDPTSGQNITTCSYTVRGTAHDYYSGVAQVEVSADDGATWSPAQGTANWTYEWTIPADGAYSLKVRARDAAGNVQAPTTSVSVTVSGNCGSGSTPTPTATPCAMSFTDVSPNDYFYEAVRYLYCAGVVSGYADGTFRPYNNTTRAQLSKIVALAEGWPIDTTGGPHFTDVPISHTFYDYIETAYNHSIITGYQDGTFRPDNNVTRAQLSKIIVQAQQWPIDTTGGPHFTDVAVGNPFYGFIETAYNHGIITGYQDGTFRPDNSATRGQICKIVYQAITQP